MFCGCLAVSPRSQELHALVHKPKAWSASLASAREGEGGGGPGDVEAWRYEIGSRC